MTNVLSSNPSFTSTLLPNPSSAATPAPQAGSTPTIDVDSSIHNVSWRNNRLVTAWVSGGTDRDGSVAPDDVWWVELDTSSGNPAPVAFGKVSTIADLNAKVYRYDPAIEIDPHMNL
jgi:hypothetical protein